MAFFGPCYAIAPNLSLKINISIGWQSNTKIYWKCVYASFWTRLHNTSTKGVSPSLFRSKPDIQSSSIKATSEFLLLRPEKKTQQTETLKPETRNKKHKIQVIIETSFCFRRISSGFEMFLHWVKSGSRTRHSQILLLASRQRSN